MKVQDKKFKKLLESYKPEMAPVDFTKKVMNQILKEEEIRLYKPVFGKWFLPTFGALFLAFLIITLLFITPEDVSTSPSLIGSLFSNLSNNELNEIAKLGTSVTDIFNRIPPLVFIISFSSMLLLLFDWTLQRFKKFPVR